MEDEDIYDFYDEDDLKVCSLSRSYGQADLELLKRSTKNRQYFCPECKRAANDSSLLCSPVLL